MAIPKTVIKPVYFDKSVSGDKMYFSYTTHTGPVYLDALDTQTATGTTVSNAFAINDQVTVFSTVTSSTGAVLPASQPGLWLTIINNGSNALTVYATGSDTINGTAGATGVSLANGSTAIYFSASTGTWFELVSAF
jgi:hypothetical protein